MLNIDYALNFLEQKLILNDKPLKNMNQPEIAFCGLSGVPIATVYTKRVIYSMTDYESWEEIVYETHNLFNYEQDMLSMIENSPVYLGTPYTAIYAVTLDDEKPHFSIDKGILVQNSSAWNYFAMKVVKQ